jgi:hypothetical protein
MSAGEQRSDILHQGVSFFCGSDSLEPGMHREAVPDHPLCNIPLKYGKIPEKVPPRCFMGEKRNFVGMAR